MSSASTCREASCAPPPVPVASFRGDGGTQDLRRDAAATAKSSFTLSKGRVEGEFHESSVRGLRGALDAISQATRRVSREHHDRAHCRRICGETPQPRDKIPSANDSSCANAILRHDCRATSWKSLPFCRPRFPWRAFRQADLRATAGKPADVPHR